MAFLVPKPHPFLRGIPHEHIEHIPRCVAVDKMSVIVKPAHLSVLCNNAERFAANQIKAYRVSCRFKKQFPVEHHVCNFEGFDADYLENWVYPDDRPLLYGVTSRENIQEKLSADNSFHVNYRVYRDNSIGYIQHT